MIKLMIKKRPSERITTEDLLNDNIFPSYFLDLYAFCVEFHSKGFPLFFLHLHFQIIILNYYKYSPQNYFIYY